MNRTMRKIITGAFDRAVIHIENSVKDGEHLDRAKRAAIRDLTLSPMEQSHRQDIEAAINEIRYSDLCEDVLTFNDGVAYRYYIETMKLPDTWLRRFCWFQLYWTV